MGVCGVGKSTVARALAERCESGFVEADDYHPPENVEAMRNGVPLTDAMRWGWLDGVAAAALAARKRHGGPVFLACSGLKKSYRDRLRRSLGPIAIIDLQADKGLLAHRMRQRRGHFMSPRLLDSQIAAFEPPDPDAEGAISINAAEPVEEIVRKALAGLRAGVLAAEVPTEETRTATVTRRKTQ